MLNQKKKYLLDVLAKGHEADRHRDHHRGGASGGDRPRSRSQSRSPSQRDIDRSHISQGRIEHSKRRAQPPRKPSSSHKPRPRSSDDENTLHPPSSSKSTANRARDQEVARRLKSCF